MIQFMLDLLVSLVQPAVTHLVVNLMCNQTTQVKPFCWSQSMMGLSLPAHSYSASVQPLQLHHDQP